MRVTLYGNVGGNTVSYVPLVNGSRIVSTVYDVPLACVRVMAIMTNTLPSIHYRGAGRPQAMHAMERLLDMAADEMDIDRIALRRRNLVADDAFPYVNPTGLTYDCGAFETNMDMAMELADWDGFDARRAVTERQGSLRGLGISNFIETPVGAPIERAEIEVRPDETVVLVIGTQSSGQGHETSFAQVVSQWLGVPFEAVEMVTGDTDSLAVGGGTHSDRSIRMGGKVMVEASEAIIAKGRAIASHVLEVAEADVEFAAGRFTVAGTDRSLGIFEVARAASGGEVPDDLAGPLAGAGQYLGRLPAYPNGSAVCEVEIDPATGVVEIMRYSVVDDVGRVINPMIVHGQTHGGIAQGVGQVLMENCVYEEASGQLLTGSFMDYCMPRADDLPFFATAGNEVITDGNPLGVKGGGEAGTTGALAVVMGAIVDALKVYGITEFQMPATPERVWRAIRDAGASR
jgi:carbon-monoxide dehydrogenase large subunit